MFKRLRVCILVRKNIYHIISVHVAVSQCACEASWMGGWGEGGGGCYNIQDYNQTGTITRTLIMQIIDKYAVLQAPIDSPTSFR